MKTILMKDTAWVSLAKYLFLHSVPARILRLWGGGLRNDYLSLLKKTIDSVSGISFAVQLNVIFYWFSKH